MIEPVSVTHIDSKEPMQSWTIVIEKETFSTSSDYYSVNWRVYMSFEDAGERKYTDSMSYVVKDTIQEANPFASGRLRWDGCDRLDTAEHFCDSSSLSFVKAMLVAIEKSTEIANEVFKE